MGLIGITPKTASHNVPRYLDITSDHMQILPYEYNALNSLHYCEMYFN